MMRSVATTSGKRLSSFGSRGLGFQDVVSSTFGNEAKRCRNVKKGTGGGEELTWPRSACRCGCGLKGGDGQYGGGYFQRLNRQGPGLSKVDPRKAYKIRALGPLKRI